MHYGSGSEFNPDRLILDGFVLAGDYNRNGTVDAADYVLWRDTLGQSVAPGEGADGDLDSLVSQADYDVWRAHFGESVGSGAALSSADTLSATVPEPATQLLLILASTCCCLRRRRGRIESSVNS